MRHPFLPSCALAAAVLATAGGAVPATAVAASDTMAPYYDSFAFGGIARDGGFSFAEGDVITNGHQSNIAPQVLERAAGTLNAEGASMSFDAWAAYSGFYAARSYATMTVNNAQVDHDYYAVAGQGTTTVARFFTPEAAAARATFTWRVTGSALNLSDTGWADGRVDFYATTEPGHSWFDLFNGNWPDRLFEYGPGTYSFTLPVADLGTPIYLYFWTSAFTQVEAGQFEQGASFTLLADFANTVVLEEVSLVDEFDNPIPEWSMEDAESGELLFNDSGRIADIAPPPAIPEPGSFVLLAAGLAAVGWRVRRRQVDGV